MENYVLLMCDDLGYGDTGFNGHPHIQTPNLDRLASEGMILSRFYAGAPVCSPTRASCLTGRHPYRLGVFTANEGHLAREEITIAEMLKKKGYTTGFFGKWHLGTLSKTIKDGRRGGPRRPELYSPPWDHHFDMSFAAEVQMPLWDPMSNQKIPSKYWTGQGEYATENLEGDDSRVIMDRAVPFIKNAIDNERPFLAVIWFHTPHEPVVAGPEYRNLYRVFDEKQQHYYGAITAMDEQIGRLLDTLDEMNVDENTMVWFCSDNGPESTSKKNGILSGIGSTGGLRGRKRSLFNGGIQVPAVLKWPKYIPRSQLGTRIDFPTSTLDFLPTILADSILTIPDSRPIDGMNLLPFLNGAITQRVKPIPFRFRESKFSMFGSPTFGLIDGRMKFLTNFNKKKSEDMVFDVVSDRAESQEICSNNMQYVRKAKEYLQDQLLSFENSHRGGDYPGQTYHPVNKYISNALGWKTRGIKRKRKKKFRWPPRKNTPTIP